VNIKPPKTSTAKRKSNGADTVFQVKYGFYWIPAQENSADAQNYACSPTANGYSDAAVVCSWNLSLTLPPTNRGENNT